MRKALLYPLIAIPLFATPVGAQETTCMDAGDKNPTTARALGIVPGAGHIYACEFLRGLGYYIVTTSLVVVGAAELNCPIFASDGGCARSADVALLAGIGLWAWSIYDAGRAAHRTNARRGSRLSVILTPEGSRWSDGRRIKSLKVGLSVRVG
jgi:hypothetical protein